MSDRSNHQDIRIGTLVKAGKDIDSAGYIRQINAHGFESYQLMFWQEANVDFQKLADDVQKALDDAPGDIKPTISSLGMFGNPLENETTQQGWAACIDACEKFGCNVVAGFAGALTGKSVPDAMPRYKEVFGPLADQALDKGVRLAFENCDMGGDWNRGTNNIAHAPKAWEMMFEATPQENVGLEWEPCHQMNSLIDPLPQLREWAHKVFHLHGKDATVFWDRVRTVGTRGGEKLVYHRHPGFGDTNWTDVISILRMAGFEGAIDIEGWHDPVYRGDLEMTGQVHALNYLKHCRGGAFVPNPS